jgi:activator of HSP90 ATPase
MAHGGSHNSNNDDNNDVENPSSMLEQLLIVQVQLLRTVQQILEQMQDINLLMESMEIRPSLRKRKSNTHNDFAQAQKINAIKNAAPNPKEGSTSAKATTTCFNRGEVGHFANRCPQDRGDWNVQTTLTEEIGMCKRPRPTKMQSEP